MDLTVAQCVQRSMQDIASATILVARSPVLVGDDVDVFVLTRTVWIGLEYHVTFNDDDEPRRISNPTTLRNDSSPVWITHDEFVSSAGFDDRQLTSTDGVVWAALSHRYVLPGTHVIRLFISGQLTHRGPVQRAEIAVNVLIRDRPSLRGVIGHVTLVSQSEPAYVNESVRFLYAVERLVDEVICQVYFATDLDVKVRAITCHYLVFFSLMHQTRWRYW